MTPTFRERWRRGERFLKKTLSTTVLRRFRHSCEYWRIGLRSSATPLWEDGPSALPSFRWLDAPRGHFYADPFLFDHRGRVWLFAEDYRYATDEARTVVVAEVLPNGEVGPFREALTEAHHMSYPAVFSHEGETFLLPETAANRTVQLYRAVDFPVRWVREAVLFPHPAFDTTPLCHDGRWWFFTTIPEQGGKEGLRTHLFSAETLTGEWRMHPASPIGRPYDGRGAGLIVNGDGRLLRPTQCAQPRYGYSFSFDEIVHLDNERFVERRVRTFEPTWRRHLRGMHTYGRVGHIEVIDGCWGVNPYDVM